MTPFSTRRRPKPAATAGKIHAHTLVLSRFILDEVERVLLYPRIQARYRITPAEAADGKSDVLCTGNSRHFAVPEVQDFCAAHGIRVMTDVEVLRDLLP